MILVTKVVNSEHAYSSNQIKTKLISQANLRDASKFIS